MNLSKKITLGFTIIVSATFLFNAFTFADSNNKVTPHKKFYKYNADNKEWAKFKSVKERRQDLQLDEKQLKNLSTEELLIAVLEYPFIGDLSAFNSYDLAIKGLSKHCIALREFTQRDDTSEVLEKAKTGSKELVSILNVSKENKDIVPMVIDILYYKNILGIEENLEEQDEVATISKSVVDYVDSFFEHNLIDTKLL